ncbi:MAG: protein-glutamate O-methyltransferase CheR [Treponemataceae bacterium]|nr:protein-glutamate O-methyltransferase CheR [Treponemataceae bacterium]
MNYPEPAENMRRSSELTDELFKGFQNYLYHHTGITIRDNKKYLVEYRLQRYIGEDKPYKSFSDLYRALEQKKDPQLERIIINSLTTNYTYFFREKVHFRFLEYYLTTYGSGQSYIRLWSAGCSSGEEAYSMAITCLEAGYAYPEKDIRILATDISERVLKKAKEATYHYSSLHGELSDSQIRRYFQFNKKTKEFSVQDFVRSLVVIRELNLMDIFPFSRQFDVIFLRNVLIYFNAQEKEQILEKMYDVLKNKGYLVLGLSESLVGLRHNFQPLNYSIYRKGGNTP